MALPVMVASFFFVYMVGVNLYSCFHFFKYLKG